MNPDDDIINRPWIVTPSISPNNFGVLHPLQIKSKESGKDYTYPLNVKTRKCIYNILIIIDNEVCIIMHVRKNLYKICVCN